MPRPRHSTVVPGQQIYAYCNVKTNQVLYSLTRTLQHKHLKQLPDTGANNNPPKIRKDLWRPLWSVQLPDGEDGVAQGQQAFKMLRDFRDLHETTWTPPKSMSVPYTEKQIKKLEEKLEARGGSKKESPYDLIARRKWKIRANMVMNQKANSVADLAAVLRWQEYHVEEQVRKRQKARNEELREIEELAELAVKDDGAGMKELEKEILDLTAARDARAEDRRRRKLTAKIEQATMKLGRMKLAAEWVPKAKRDAAEAEEERRVAKEKAAEAKAKAEEERAKSPASTQEAATAAEEQELEEFVEEEEEILWGNFVPSFPPELVLTPLDHSKFSRKNPPPLQRQFPPVFPHQGGGVTVRWANTLDAEYAEEWPALVRHEPMGLVRNTAPQADDEQPYLDVAEWKSLQWKRRSGNFAVGEGLAEKVERRRREMGLVEHPLARNRFVKKEELEGLVATPRPSEGAEAVAAAAEGSEPKYFAAFDHARREAELAKLLVEASKSIGGKRMKVSENAVDAALMDAAEPTATEARV